MSQHVDLDLPASVNRCLEFVVQHTACSPEQAALVALNNGLGMLAVAHPDPEFQRLVYTMSKELCAGPLRGLRGNVVPFPRHDPHVN